MKNFTFGAGISPRILIIVCILFGGLFWAGSADAEIIHFAFFNPDNEAKDPITAVSAMKPFADYMGEDVGVEIKIHYLLRKKDLERVFKQYKVGIALLSPLYFVENKERLGLVPFAMPIVEDDITYRLITVAKKDAGFNSLKDLEGKTLAYTALGEDNFDLLNLFVFNGEIKVEKFFAKLLEVPSPSAAVMSVLYNQTDCACVTSGLYETLKELNPQVSRDTTSVYLSPKILRSPFCYLKENIAVEKVNKMSAMLFKMHESPIGQQSLMPFKIDGFKPTTYEPFEPMEKLLASAASTPTEKTTKEPEKVTVQRVKSVASDLPAGLKITKITHKYLSAKDALHMKAQVQPDKDIKTVELIYQLSGQKRQTRAMKAISPGKYTAEITLPATKTTDEVQEVVYEVKSGDTLGKISKKYYGEIKKWIMIATYNRLANPNVIYVGQKLKIKVSGQFENVTYDTWVKAMTTKGDVVLSPKKIILITR